MPRIDDLDRTPATRTPDYSQYLPAGHPAGWTGPYGAAYEVPDPRWAAEMARIYNEQALPFLKNTANDYNLFNYNQRLGQVEGTPGIENIHANQQGILSPDSIWRQQQLAAQRGISTGAAYDAPNTSAALLRAYGLESEALKKLGQEQYNARLDRFPQAAPFDLMSGMIDQDTIGAALLQAAINKGLPNPREAALEEHRKLLEAIEAGKAAGGAGGPAGGGTDYSKLISDWLKAQSDANKGPQTVVGRGPNQTIDRGNNFFVPSPQDIRYNPLSTYKDPGTSGYNAAGLRNDVIKNAGAGNFVNSIFQTPAYEDNAVRGGLGLDPVLNAVLSRERSINNMTALGMNPNGTYFNPGATNFGAPFTSQGVQYDINPSQWDPYGTHDPNQYAFGQPINTRDLYSGVEDSGWLGSIFDTPSYSDYGALGGYGLDPTLNALLGGGGLGDSSVFGAITPNDRSSFGAPLFPDTGGSYFDDLFSGGGPSYDDDVMAWLGFD